MNYIKQIIIVFSIFFLLPINTFALGLPGQVYVKNSACGSPPYGGYATFDGYVKANPGLYCSNSVSATGISCPFPGPQTVQCGPALPPVLDSSCNSSSGSYRMNAQWGTSSSLAPQYYRQDNGCLVRFVPTSSFKYTDANGNEWYGYEGYGTDMGLKTPAPACSGSNCPSTSDYFGLSNQA